MELGPGPAQSAVFVTTASPSCGRRVLLKHQHPCKKRNWGEEGVSPSLRHRMGDQTSDSLRHQGTSLTVLSASGKDGTFRGFKAAHGRHSTG